MKNITIKYGSDTRTVTVDDNITIGEMIANPTTKAVLGYGDNVRSLVSGVEQPNGACPGDNTMVVLETRANSKANSKDLLSCCVQLNDSIKSLQRLTTDIISHM